MKTLKVSLIEDDGDDALLIKDMLAECKDHRFQIRVSPTVGEGLEALSDDVPDLVLLDLSLPDTIGFDGLQQIKATAPAADLIILTGNNDDRVGLEAMRLGASDYLIKGRIDSEVLVRTILFSQERRKLQNQLRQAQKVEAVGRLAGGIAHDFNNQLGILTLLTSEIRRTNSDEQLKQPIEQLEGVVEKCCRLVSKILSFSRNQVLEPESFEIKNILNEILPLMQRMVGSNIKILTQFQEGDHWIRVDRIQFEQVIWNLIINAKDAIGEHGRVTIAVSNDPTTSQVLIDISDDGPGIPKDILPSIFDPFFTTKPKGVGTGLGLASAMSIIHQSGGTIEAVSDCGGRGACFRIAFPYQEPKVVPATKNLEVVPLTPKTILVCDDEQMLLDLMEELLTESGHKVFTSSSPVKAIEIFKAHPEIDVVITDLTMPEMSGKEFGQALDKLRPDTNILYISGYSEDLSENPKIKKNVKYLAKPFSRQSLLSTLKNMF